MAAAALLPALADPAFAPLLLLLPAARAAPLLLPMAAPAPAPAAAPVPSRGAECAPAGEARSNPEAPAALLLLLLLPPALQPPPELAAASVGIPPGRRSPGERTFDSCVAPSPLGEVPPAAAPAPEGAAAAAPAAAAPACPDAAAAAAGGAGNRGLVALQRALGGNDAATGPRICSSRCRERSPSCDNPADRDTSAGLALPPPPCNAIPPPPSLPEATDAEEPGARLRRPEPSPDRPLPLRFPRPLLSAPTPAPAPAPAAWLLLCRGRGPAVKSPNSSS